METAVAGALGGVLMGLAFQAHMALLLVFRPPEKLLRRAGEQGVLRLIMWGSLFAVTTWALLGVAAGGLFSAFENGFDSDLPSVPSIPYLGAVLFIAAMTAIPLLVFVHDRGRHMALQYALFIGIFGWLIPNVVEAARS